MTADLKGARERVEHLAKVYAARANRKLTPDWSAAQKAEDAASSKALSTLLTALDQAAEALKGFNVSGSDAIIELSATHATIKVPLDVISRAATVYATLKSEGVG